MSPKIPRLRWDDPLRAWEMLASLWSSSPLSSVGAGAAQAVTVPYRTLFTLLQQLLVGREIMVDIGVHRVALTVTELDSVPEPPGLAVGQLGEVRVAARDIRWGPHRLESAVAVLRNVHLRPGMPPLVVAAPIELSSTLSAQIVDEAVRQAVPQLRSQLCEDGTARLRWARRPGWGCLEVDVDVVGTVAGAILCLQPRALRTGRRRWRLSSRIPAYQVPLPDLPHGLLVTQVGVGLDSLRLSALLPQWHMELPLRYLEDFITQLGQGALGVTWPSLLRGSG